MQIWENREVVFLMVNYGKNWNRSSKEQVTLFSPSIFKLNCYIVLLCQVLKMKYSASLLKFHYQFGPKIPFNLILWAEQRDVMGIGNFVGQLKSRIACQYVK